MAGSDVLCTIAVQMAFGNYKATVLGDSPFGFWRLDDTSSISLVAKDSTSNHDDGTYSGGVTFAQAGPLPDASYGVFFDGLAGQVALPSFTYGNNISVEFWINTSSTLAAGLVSNRAATTVTGAFFIGMSVSGFGHIQVFADDGGGTSVVGSKQVNDGKWHHVVVTNDSSTTKIYVDGVLDISSAQARSNRTGPVYIAADLENGTHFNGNLSQVAYYTSILSSSQVTAHFNAAAWTDVSSDVRISQACRVNYGIQGNTPTDRVAGAGTFTFALDNSEHNSGGLQGYYSPFNANLRSGFGLGTPTRLAITYTNILGTTTFYKFRGRISSIDVLPGQYRDRYVNVIAADWMDEAARWRMKGIATQIGQRTDQLITILANSTPIPAPARSFDSGKDTDPYALDNVYDESSTALTVLQQLMLSEWGFVYIKGDTIQGGTLRYENRDTRLGILTDAATFDNTMVDMSTPVVRDNVVNRVQATAHPRTADTMPVVLYSLPTVTNPPVIPASGGTLTLRGLFRDPLQLAQRVGGTSMINPVAHTDFTVNTDTAGLGTDLTASVTLSVVFSSNSADFTFTNPTSTPGYVTFLQCRGLGLYDYVPVICESDDATSQGTYGISLLTIDMPEQSSTVAAQAIADDTVARWKNPLNLPKAVTFEANTNDTLMVQALTREPGDRIHILEAVTGMGTSYFINAVQLDISPGQNLRCSWTLALANTTQYWALNVSGSGELGTHTTLAPL